MADDWRPWRKTSPELLARYVNEAAAAEAVLPDFFRIEQDQSGRTIHDLRTAGKIEDVVQALYDGLCHFNIDYDLEPVLMADPGSYDQRIRSPAELVSEKKGTCVDLALFFGGLCVHVHLLPMIVLLQTDKDRAAHALVVVDGQYTNDDWNEPRGWTEQHRKNAMIGAGQKHWGREGDLWRRIADGKYIPVECTGFARTHSGGRSSPTLSFREARELAMHNLENMGHRATLDVVRFQKEKGYEAYRPPTLHWPRSTALGLWHHTQKAHLERLQYPFVGRRHALARVEGFLSEPDGPRRLCIIAPAGFGKSTLMARLVLSYPGSVYQFVGEHDSWTDLVGSLCTQLSALAGENARYYQTPRAELKQQLESLLSEVARRREKDRPLPIFIDGLDEGISQGRDRVIQSDVFSEPPDGVRLVVSCRPGLEGLLSGIGPPLTLGEFDEADVRDLLIFFERPDLAGDHNLVRSLVQRTAGEPFYLRYLTEDVASAGATADVLDQLPKKAEDYLKDQTRRLIESWEPCTAITLAVLVHTKGWIRQDSLFHILHNEISNDVTRRVLELLRPRYLTTQAPSDPLRRTEETYRLWPLRLQDAIHSMLTAPELETGKNLIIDFCRNWPAHRDRYGLENAFSHFIDAGKLEYLPSLMSRDFLQARAEIDGGFHGPLRDTENAVRLAAKRRDIPMVVRTAGTHAWLLLVVGWRARNGGLALDARTGRVRSALAGARAIPDPRLRRTQLLLIAEALLDQKRDDEAADVVEEAVKLNAVPPWLDQHAVNALARLVVKRLGRVDLARGLWMSSGSSDMDRMLSDVALELVEHDPDRAFEIANTLGDEGARQDVLEELALKRAGEPLAAFQDSRGWLSIGEEDPSTPNAELSIAELISIDPAQALHYLKLIIAQCRERLSKSETDYNEDDYDAIILLNSAIMDLAAIDPAAAVDLSLTEARPYTWQMPRGRVLAEVGATIASHNGPIELIRRLLDAARESAAEEPNRRPSPVDSLSESLLSLVSDEDEIFTVLAQMDDKDLAAAIGLEKFSTRGNIIPRLVTIIAAASTVTDRLSAAFRTVSPESAEQILAALPPGPIQWWLKLAIAKDEPSPAEELRSAAQALPLNARFAAMLELSRRFHDPLSLQEAARLLEPSPGPSAVNNSKWHRDHDRRPERRLKLARIASEIAPTIALKLYRDAALDIPERWHENARHHYAVKVLEALANNSFQVEQETLRLLFNLLQTDYSKGWATLRVPGTDALISKIADEVKAPAVPVVVELLKTARDLADDWSLEQLESLFPDQSILALKLARARLSEPGTEELQERIRAIVQIFTEPVSKHEYPDHLIFEVGELLAREQPETLEAVCSNLSLEQRPAFWAGAALKITSTDGRYGAADQLIRNAEHAAAEIDEGAAHYMAKKERPRSKESAIDSERRQRIAQAAMGSAAAFANLAICVGEAFAQRRKHWVSSAFSTLRQVDEAYERLPLTMDIVLKLASCEPTLCRREATRALELFPAFLAEGAGLQKLRRVLEQDWTNSVQIAIQREAWEAIVNLVSYLPEVHRAWERPPIELEPEFFALAGYWVTKLGGQVPCAFWETIETSIFKKASLVEAKSETPAYRQALAKSIFAELKAGTIFSKAAAQLFASMMAARLIASQSEPVGELYELAENQEFLAYALRYLPEAQIDWHRLLGCIRSLTALEAAIRRFSNHPLVAELLPLLEDYPPSEHRSRILTLLLDAAEDMTFLPRLRNVALDYPGDLVRWAATYVRLGCYDKGVLRATINELVEVRQLSAAVCPR